MGILTALIWVYVAITFVTFLASAFASMTGLWPASIRVPWSQLGSFVETRDGVVLAEITMWGRIERYDRNGRFLGSWRQPFAKGSVALATDEDGRVYLWHASDVFRLGPHGELLTRYTASSRPPHSWRLAPSGEPERLPQVSGPVQRKVVQRGEVLFSDKATRHFTISDGTVLQPAMHSLSRVAPGGQRLMTYSAPWYLWPLRFPLPALLAWIAALLVVIARAAK